MSLQDYITPRKDDYILSEEAGKAEVRRFLDAYEIGIEDMDASIPVEHKEAFVSELDFLTRCYRVGKLENKEDTDLGFCVVQHTKKGSTITYRELKSKDLDVLFSLDKSSWRGQTALLGKISGLGADAIGQLRGEDKKAAVLLAVFFMNA